MKKLLTIAALVFSMNAMSQDVYIPNAFTPNGDGINDTWKPEFSDTLNVKGYNLEIYDRSGVQVFKSDNPNVWWDGLPFDTVYVYRFYMRCKGFNEAIHESGSITLIH
jgi:gliding motility-associated-like protein|tara:strand:- start:275 stop:598 length:324 start_codon:yes stop_codon:yes gene_type:complete